MRLDVIDLRNFYARPLGGVVASVLGQELRSLWTNTQSLAVLGIGYTMPYLDRFRGEAERVIALMPDAQGAINWPPDGPSATVLASPSALPFPDSSIDRALIVHALETEDRPRDLLDEVWRVLTPGGRIIVIVPNRRGLWARIDSSPFGHGQPFSRGQLIDVLRETLFSPTGWIESLHFPPFSASYTIKSARFFERTGKALGLPFSGAHIVEATKLLYRPITVSRTRRVRSVLNPVLVPIGSPRLDETAP